MCDLSRWLFLSCKLITLAPCQHVNHIIFSKFLYQSVQNHQYMLKKNKILMKMNPLSVAVGLRELVRNLLESLDGNFSRKKSSPWEYSISINSCFDKLETWHFYSSAFNGNLVTNGPPLSWLTGSHPDNIHCHQWHLLLSALSPQSALWLVQLPSTERSLAEPNIRKPCQSEIQDL